MIPFDQIPFSFLLKNLTFHQKGTIEIKYYIKQEMNKCEGIKQRRYEQLADELHLSIRRVRMIEQS